MPTIEERAREALNAVSRERDDYARWDASDTREDTIAIETVCRLIEAHDATIAKSDAFKQEVSDAVNGFERYCTVTDTPFPTDLSRFILPKPVDPLVEAIREASVSDADDGDASRLRAALAKRGGRIVFKEVGDV